MFIVRLRTIIIGRSRFEWNGVRRGGGGAGGSEGVEGKGLDRSTRPKALETGSWLIHGRQAGYVGKGQDSSLLRYGNSDTPILALFMAFSFQLVACVAKTCAKRQPHIIFIFFEQVALCHRNFTICVCVRQYILKLVRYMLGILMPFWKS